MMKLESRYGTSKLVGLAIAATLTVGLVGCATPATTATGANTSGETSSSVSAQSLVDVAAVWATHPLPDCPKPPIKRNGGQVPLGIELPTESTVSDILAGTKSPAPEQWVRTKLGWVTQELLAARADIIAANAPGDDSMLEGFKRYVSHVRDELQAGHDVSNPIDKTYPEGCS